MEENTALSAEAFIVLNLVDALAQNMKESEERNILTSMDFRKVCELLTSDALKSIRITGDSGSIVSRIIELEIKSKI